VGTSVEVITAISAAFAKGITARNALPAAGVVMRPSARDVRQGAQYAMSRFAQTVFVLVQCAALTAASSVWKKIFVKIAKKARIKMNSETNPSQQTVNAQTQTSLIQLPKKSILLPKERSRLALRFNPAAWAKLAYFRDKTENEVGGFAITEVDDLLNVQEFITVKQEVTSISVKFDDIAVADFFETQVDLGRKPEQFARIWLHTHPGDSPEPSGQDETTFARVFGKCNWALMFILAENNKTYAKLSFNVGPKGEIIIPVEVDYSQNFGPSDHKLWDEEYQANVSHAAWLSDFDLFTGETTGSREFPAIGGRSYDFIGELEKLDPIERQMVLDELANRPDLWNDGEVMFI
jgi:proteasome lid subunit RPN8/RPN11